MSWPLVELGKISKVTTGQSAPQAKDAFSEDGLPFLRAGSLKTLVSGKNENEFEHINSQNAQKFNLKLFPRGSVIFAKSGMSSKIGLVHKLNCDCYIVSHLAAVICDENLVNPDFLKRWFEKFSPANLIANDSYPSIRTSDIANLKIPLPPLEEQKQIAAILDKADALRRKREKAIQLTDTLLRSVFLDMFGDPVTNPKGWEIKKLGDYILTLTSGSRGWAKYYAANGAKFLRIQNVGFATFKPQDMAFVNAPYGAEATRTKVKADDLLVSITAELGRTAVVPNGFGDGHISQHLAKISLTGICPYFVSHYISSKGGLALLAAKNKGGVKAGLNFDDIRTIPVFNVPHDEQQKFKKIREKILQGKSVNLNCSGVLSDFLASLTQRAFRGELTSKDLDTLEAAQ